MVRPSLKASVLNDETPRHDFKPTIMPENRHFERFAKLREFIKEHSYSPRDQR